MIRPWHFVRIFTLILGTAFLILGIFSSSLFYSQAQGDELDPTLQAAVINAEQTITAGGDFGGIRSTVEAAATATSVAASVPRISKNNIDNVVELSRLQGHIYGVTSVSFHPNGIWLLSGSFGTNPILWNIEAGKDIRTFIGHTGDVTSVAISPNGQTALSSSVDGSVILWDLQTGEIIHRMVGHSGWVLTVAYSPDGTQALSGSVDTTLILWDLETGEPIRSLRGHRDTVFDVAFSPADSNLGASASCGNYAPIANGFTCDEGAIFLWDLNAGEQIGTLEGHEGMVYSLAFSQDGRQILSGAADNTAILWDVEERAIIHRYPDCNNECDGHTNDVKSVSLSDDGQLVLTGSDDRSAIIWDLNTSKILRRFEFTDHARAVSFGPLNQVFAVGNRNRLIYIFGLPQSK